LSTLDYPIFSFTTLLIFMILMPILLMNLLIGLAVGDIEAVRRNAQLKRMAMQVELHTELERKLPEFILQKVYTDELVEYPNKTCRHFSLLQRLLSMFSMFFANRLQREAQSMEGRLKEDQLMDEISVVKKQLKDVRSVLDSLSQLQKLMLQKMEIKTEAEELEDSAALRTTL
jgi:transient receptor potential cation channel subfamily A protein 1